MLYPVKLEDEEIQEPKQIFWFISVSIDDKVFVAYGARNEELDWPRKAQMDRIAIALGDSKFSMRRYRIGWRGRPKDYDNLLYCLKRLKGKQEYATEEQLISASKSKEYFIA